MTRLIRCPSCGTSLEVSAKTLGRSVRCGRCASVFTASESGQGNPAPMEETDKGASDRDEAAPDRRGGRRQRRRWEDDDNDYDDSRDDRWDVRRVRRRDLVTIRSRVTPAAVFLMVYGGLLIFGGLLSLLPLGYGALQLSAPAKPLSASEKEDAIAMAVIFGIFAFIGLTTGLVIFWGALRMKALRSHGLAMTAAILSSVVGFLFCILLAAVGIWPLIVLVDPEVRAAFDRPRH